MRKIGEHIEIEEEARAEKRKSIFKKCTIFSAVSTGRHSSPFVILGITLSFWAFPCHPLHSLCHPGHSLVILNEVKDLLLALYKSSQSRPYDLSAIFVTFGSMQAGCIFGKYEWRL